jgi:hypothetical protein
MVAENLRARRAERSRLFHALGSLSRINPLEPDAFFHGRISTRAGSSASGWQFTN